MEASDSPSDVEGNFCGLPGKLRVSGTDCWPGRPWKKVIIFSITLAQSYKSGLGTTGPAVTVGLSTQAIAHSPVAVLSASVLTCTSNKNPGNLLGQKSTNTTHSRITSASTCMSPDTQGPPRMAPKAEERLGTSSLLDEGAYPAFYSPPSWEKGWQGVSTSKNPTEP